jgi:hypothetical protein
MTPLAQQRQPGSQLRRTRATAANYSLMPNCVDVAELFVTP